MLDVKEGVSEGKAMDMMQTAQLLGFDTTVTGCTNDYEKKQLTLTLLSSLQVFLVNQV